MITFLLRDNIQTYIMIIGAKYLLNKNLLSLICDLVNRIQINIATNHVR